MKREKELALLNLKGALELPSVESLISILQCCRKEGNLADAKCIHALMRKHGLEGHALLGNYLVPMLVECGSLSDAQQVFHGLAHRNEHSWTSLMHGYIECGDSQNAIDLYQQMQEYCIHPSRYVLQALLKACAKLKDAARGQEVHFEIVRMGFERDPFVGSVLVNMYAKSGLLAAAESVFDKLQVRNVVLWTSIVTGYIEHGLVDEALKCVERMQVEGVSPNAITFVCILKGCSSVEAVDKAREVHSEVVKHGFEMDFCVNSTLVDMYAKCGSLAEAQKVFQELPVRDVVLWTALIAGYAELGFGEEALNRLDQMQQEGTSPNAVTYVYGLKACGYIRTIDKVQEIHAEIVKEGFESLPCVGSTLVDTYGKCGSLSEAQEVFDGLPFQDPISWNSLTAAYMEHGLSEDAFYCVEKMQLEGMSLNSITFVCTLKACGSRRLIEWGQKIHAEIIREGFERDPFVGSTLVDMYAKCAFFPEAWAVIEELPVQNAVTWTALIAGYIENGLCKEALNCLTKIQLDGMPLDAVAFVCGLKACGSIGAIERGHQMHAEIAKEGYEKEPSVGSTLVDMYVKCGLLKEAQDVFDELPVPQVASWTALMGGYAELRLNEQALGCFERMPREKITPDAVILVSGLKACGSLGALEKGRVIHADIAKEGLDEDLSIGSSLVDMYAKCGSLVEAWEVFDDLVDQQNLVLWTALITGYACQGESEIVCCVFERMMEEGIQPDAVTFLNVLTVCSHAGLVEKGLSFFEAISNEFGNVPTIELHNCLMDLLSRAGQLDVATAMLEKMPFQPNLVTWNTILGACQKQNNVELGRHAFQCAVRLDAKQSAAYISMVNIYADAHMWEDVKKIELLRELAWSHGAGLGLVERCIQDGVLWTVTS